MGDLNCDLSKFPLESNARKLQFLSSLYQLDQLINEPTRVKEQMQLRDFYKKQAVKHSSQIHWNMYRKTGNELNLKMRLAKKKYFCDKINTCA